MLTDGSGNASQWLSASSSPSRPIQQLEETFNSVFKTLYLNHVKSSTCKLYAKSDASDDNLLTFIMP